MSFHLRWRTKQAGRVSIDGQGFNLGVPAFEPDEKSLGTLRLALIQNGAELY